MIQYNKIKNMEIWKNFTSTEVKISSLLNIERLLLIILLSVSFSDSKHEHDYSNYICDLESQIEMNMVDREELQCELENFLTSSKAQARFIHSNEIKIERGQPFPFNHNLTVDNEVYRPSGSLNILVALLEYNGPDAVITSMHRTGSRNSDHFTKNAVDFRYNIQVIQWLGSDAGLKWLKQNNLYYYIEDNHMSSFLRRWIHSIHHKHLLVNSHASAKHIHFGIK